MARPIYGSGLAMMAQALAGQAGGYLEQQRERRRREESDRAYNLQRQQLAQAQQAQETARIDRLAQQQSAMAYQQMLDQQSALESSREWDWRAEQAALARDFDAYQFDAKRADSLYAQDAGRAFDAYQFDAKRNDALADAEWKRSMQMEALARQDRSAALGLATEGVDPYGLIDGYGGGDAFSAQAEAVRQIANDALLAKQNAKPTNGLTPEKFAELAAMAYSQDPEVQMMGANTLNAYGMGAALPSTETPLNAPAGVVSRTLGDGLPAVLSAFVPSAHFGENLSEGQSGLSYKQAQENVATARADAQRAAEELDAMIAAGVREEDIPEQKKQQALALAKRAREARQTLENMERTENYFHSGLLPSVIANTAMNAYYGQPLW